MRRRPDSNWGIELLQSSALPLGYVAMLDVSTGDEAGGGNRTRASTLGRSQATITSHPHDPAEATPVLPWSERSPRMGSDATCGQSLCGEKPRDTFARRLTSVFFSACVSPRIAPLFLPK